MTKEHEQAINRLQDAKDGYKEYLTDEALDIAIQAIKDLDKMNGIALDLASENDELIEKLDAIRAEIEQKARPNEIGGRGNGKSIRYGLCIALNIIDKYKTKSEVEE